MFHFSLPFPVPDPVRRRPSPRASPWWTLPLHCREAWSACGSAPRTTVSGTARRRLHAATQELRHGKEKLTGRLPRLSTIGAPP
jgi:hypothetical protein